MDRTEILRSIQKYNAQYFQDWVDNSELTEVQQNKICDLVLHTNGTEAADLERYQIRWADEALGDLPEIPWLINRLIKEKSIVMLYGDGGVGKTWSTLDLAICLSQGKEWLGHETRQTTVLFVDEESGQDYLLHRIKAVRQGHFHETEGLPLAFLSLAGLNLLEETDQDRLHDIIKELDAGVVILDAFIDFIPGANENLASDIQPFFQALRRIANDTGCTFIIIHHANKMGGQRGSTAIRGAVDLLLLLQKNDIYLNFENDKTRHIPEGKFTAAATFVENETGDVIEFWLTPAAGPPDSEHLTKGEAFVTRFLEVEGATALPTIQANADTCSEGTARNAVYNLVGKGKVYRTNPGESGKGVKAIYDLVPATEEEPKF